jgi:DNA modification methylase
MTTDAKIINDSSEMVDPSTLNEHPNNPRLGNLNSVIASIKAHGFYGAVVAQKSTRNVLAGNHRLRAAKTLKLEEIPVIWLDIDDEQAIRILVADNRTSDLAEYNDQALAELLTSLQASTIGLTGLGFDESDLSDLLASLEVNQPGDGTGAGDGTERKEVDPNLILDRHGLNADTFGKWSIHCGDAQHVAATLEGTFDAVLCDPPYGIDFMGKGWDKAVPGPDLWQAICDKLKPGAHVLAAGGTREFHNLARGLEEGGFEIRDCLSWLYGTAMPKSHDISKAIDKHLGAKREQIRMPAKAAANNKAAGRGQDDSVDGASRPYIKEAQRKGYHETDGPIPVTPEAEAFNGFGTGLKPAWEPFILARKPLSGTYAENCLEHNAGALNIDDTRIGDEVVGWGGGAAGGNTWNDENMGLGNEGEARPVVGRWPANLILDPTAGSMLDAQAEAEVSRFFYCAKPDVAEREAGLDSLNADAPVFGAQGGAYQGVSNSKSKRANIHPTVKPIELTKYLATLLLPPRRQGHTRRILVPFSGVASEMIGCLLAGWDEVVGIEITPEYIEIAKLRIQAIEDTHNGVDK